MPARNPVPPTPANVSVFLSVPTARRLLGLLDKVRDATQLADEAVCDLTDDEAAKSATVERRMRALEATVTAAMRDWGKASARLANGAEVSR